MLEAKDIRKIAVSVFSTNQCAFGFLGVANQASRKDGALTFGRCACSLPAISRKGEMHAMVRIEPTCGVAGARASTTGIAYADMTRSLHIGIESEGVEVFQPHQSCLPQRYNPPGSHGQLDGLPLMINKSIYTTVAEAIDTTTGWLTRVYFVDAMQTVCGYAQRREMRTQVLRANCDGFMRMLAGQEEGRAHKGLRTTRGKV